MHTTGVRLSDTQLRAVSAEFVRAYEAFAVYRIPSSEVGAVQRMAANVGARVDTEDWDQIKLRETVIDTRTVASQGASDDLVRLFVVQFVAPLASEDSELLRMNGVQYIGYVPENAALVLARGTAIGRIGSAPQVQWVSVYGRALKPSVPFPPLANSTYVVQFASTAESSAHVQEFLARHEVIQSVSYLSYTNVRLHLDPFAAAALLDDPFVVSVEHAGVDQASGEREAISASPRGSGVFVYWSGAAGPFQPYRTPAGSYRNWVPVNASGYRIAMADSGVRRFLFPCAGARHPDLQSTDIQWGPDYVNANECDDDPFGHGTMVAGMAVANPSPSTLVTDQSANGTFNYAMGVAPSGSLRIQRIMDGQGVVAVGSNITTWAADAYNNSCVLQTHSHNTYGSSAGAYDTDSQMYDYAVRDTPMPMTISAGNICGGNSDCSTMVLSPATAKNVITVGASESYRPGMQPDPTNGACPANSRLRRQAGDYKADSFNNVGYVSRRGTLDGRNKPDMLAPGTMVSSTHAADDQHFCVTDSSGDYDIDTGTSFSSPQVAAAAALIDAKFSTRFSAAMLKAALIGTSYSVKNGLDRYTNAGISARPNPVQGYGKLFLADVLQGALAYRMLDESSFLPFTAAGQTRIATFTVVDQSKPVVLVLAWTDEPAVVSSGKTLVRDLDLEVQVGCYLYEGNSMDASTEFSATPPYCYSTYGYDRTNNVEMIVLPPYVGSSFTYRVYETTWGFGTHNQPFAVFASNVN